MLKLSGSSFKVELVMRLLGLAHARDTMIGSAMVGARGCWWCCGVEQLSCLALHTACCTERVALGTSGTMLCTQGQQGQWVTLRSGSPT